MKHLANMRFVYWLLGLLTLGTIGAVIALHMRQSNVWRPVPGSSWQWQLTTPVDTSVTADVYDIDMFDNSADVVAALHAKDRKVVCYINVGAWEDWRPDAKSFPSKVIGKDYDGWPGEKWLDIRQIQSIGPLISARLDQCQHKGFDAVEPDNISGYTQDTGFALTYKDQLAFNKWLATQAHKRGLSIGLKQDPDQATDLLGVYDWALNEQCFEFDECQKTVPFIHAGKAVFDAEYALGTSDFCEKASKLGFSAIRKHRELDTYQEACSANWHITVYYTPVEKFHTGKRVTVTGCLVRDCANGHDNLGSYPQDFVQKVKNEGAGRITTGNHAGQYLNWSYDTGYWLDAIASDSYGHALQPFVSAAADASVLPAGTVFQVLDCGNSGQVEAQTCNTLQAGHWKIADEFTPGLGGKKHIDLYIGEETMPNFEDSDQYVDLTNTVIAIKRP